MGAIGAHGAIRSYSGGAKLAQIAIDRTRAYTPTNTLYGVNQLP